MPQELDGLVYQGTPDMIITQHKVGTLNWIAMFEAERITLILCNIQH